MNKLIILFVMIVTGVACASTAPVANVPEQSAMGEPLNAVLTCTQAHGIPCPDTGGTCCPSTGFTFCPKPGSVYPTNQVCSKHPQ